VSVPVFGKDPIFWDVGGIPVAALPSPDGSVSIRAFDVPVGGSVLAFDVPGGRPFSLNVARDEGCEISEADFLALKATAAARADWGQELVDNLNRNVLAEAKAMEPGADWSVWTLGERTFRVSPDRTQAREFGADGSWRIVAAEYVVTRAHAEP
jgi:hypothetical protein